MSARMSALSAAALLALAGGCATQEDIRTLRRPPLPPTSVALADRGERLYKSVAIYEILGAPEFRLFDGDDLYTTRPTRAQIAGAMSAWLAEADMLSPDVRHARYLLIIEFEELRGPDVVWFTDKNARARVRYTLEDARTREKMFDRTFDAAFQARMPGVTEEMVRAGIAAGVTGGLIGGLGNDGANDLDAQNAAAAIGPLAGVAGALFGAAHDTLIWDWRDAHLKTDGLSDTIPRVADGFSRGALWGGAAASGIEASPGQLSDLEAGLAVGGAAALSGFVGAAPAGRPPEHMDDPDAIGAFDGTRRRAQAVHGMMLQNFNRFLVGLDEAELITIRRAVPCSELNPHPDRPRDPDNHRYGVAVLTQTRDAVGYDCKA